MIEASRFGIMPRSEWYAVHRRGPVVLIGLIVTLGCSDNSLSTLRPEEYVPQESDWLEHGVVLEAGADGSWDALSGSLAPSSVVKSGGLYFLYFAGADGERRIDGGPRHRAIGVAMSPDGMNFTKHSENPVITHRPNEGEEEGANTAAVSVDSVGTFTAFYGAATQIDSLNIRADGRVATSLDGLDFSNEGVVALDHADPSLYGYGDEIFPQAAYQYDGNWYVFYLVGGTRKAWDIAVAWGPSLDRLHDSALVVDGRRRSPAFITGTINWLAPDRIVLFIARDWHPNTRIEVRIADPARPQRLGDPVAVYDGQLWRKDTKGLTVYLDKEASRWLVYRSNWSGQMFLHTAPYGDSGSGSTNGR